jgi:hypothetical protein
MTFKLIALFLTGATFLTAGHAADRYITAIQVCVMESEPEEIQVSTISVDSGSNTTRFKNIGDSLSERYESRSADGRRVASTWHDGKTFDELLIYKRYIFIPPKVITSDTWTIWQGPDALTDDKSYATKRAGGKTVLSKPISKEERVLYKVRYRSMLFDEYLTHMPSYNGAHEAWTDEPIPKCAN